MERKVWFGRKTSLIAISWITCSSQPWSISSSTRGHQREYDLRIGIGHANDALDRMRPWVVLEKTAATFGTFSLIYLITEHYIMPYTPKPGESLLKSFVNLALPMMVNYLL